MIITCARCPRQLTFALTGRRQIGDIVRAFGWARVGQRHYCSAHKPVGGVLPAGQAFSIGGERGPEVFVPVREASA